MSFLRKVQLVGIAILVAVVALSVGRGAAGNETAAAQDPSSLDRRISLLEQRFYSLESSMNRLQTYITSQRSTGSSDVRDRELNQLSQDVQRLELRLREVECGLLKLDERTATAGANRRSGDARPLDPCRQNPGTQLRLPSRP